MNAGPVSRCIHCKRPTDGMCPRCRKHSCIRQACLEAHDAKCPDVPTATATMPKLNRYPVDFNEPGPEDRVIDADYEVEQPKPAPKPPAKKKSSRKRKKK